MNIKKLRTPTLDKMLANKGESQSIGNFIKWLSEKNYIISEYGAERGQRDTLFPARHNTEKLLAEYFEIDLDAAERERRKILAKLRRDA